MKTIDILIVFIKRVKPDKDKTQKCIQLYLPKEDVFIKMVFSGCPQ